MQISVTTWNGAVRVHFRKCYQSKFDHRKFYPSKQGIAPTVKQCENLKKVISEVDEMVKCSQIMLNTDHEAEVELLRASVWCR